LAIHKKLTVGSILFTYHTTQYNSYRSLGNKYQINFYALYVKNRRERTTGDTVPLRLLPTLEKLNIKCTPSYTKDFVHAVGCRIFRYYTASSDSPYPLTEHIEKAREALETFLEDSGQTGGVKLDNNEFMTQFKESKMTNKDALFALQKPLKEYVQEEIR
jgi:hypothetical protein